MTSPARTHQRIMAVADAQHSLITSAQLRELGVHTGMVSRWVAGYLWTRLLPGVHLVRGGNPDRYQRELAALLYAGEGAQLTGTTALRRLRVRAGRLQEPVDSDPWHPEAVHVLIPHSRRRSPAGYVRIERTRTLPVPTVVDGLALAPPARAIVDAAHRMREANDVYALATEAVRTGLATQAELEDALRTGSRRGSAHLRRALGHTAANTWAPHEARLREGLAASALPEPLWNEVVVSAEGRYLGQPDAWFDDVALAAEVDSLEHHAIGAGFENTLARNARYARHGVLVYPLLPARIDRDLPGVVRELAQAYAAATARPRPPVRVATAREVAAGRQQWRWGA